jgi:hypothetical protein
VESKVNQGTSFFINLPLSQDHPRRRQTDLEDHRDAFTPSER